MYKEAKRFISLFVLTAFSLLTVADPALAVGAGALSRAIQPNLSAEDFFEAMKSLEIPDEFAAVSEVYWPEGEGSVDKFVVYIQDAHANEDAAMNIQKIIEHVQSHYELPYVFLEGGEGELDSLFFRSFPDRGLKESVLKEYIARGELSGGEMASVLDDFHETKYVGIESKALYEQNKESFLKAQESKRSVNSVLWQLRRELHELASKKLSKDAQKFLQQSIRFNQNYANLSDYLVFLKSVYPVGLRKSFSTKYSEIHAILLAAENEERNFTSAEVAVEMSEFLRKVKKYLLPKLEADSEINLNQKIQAFQVGELSQGDLVSEIIHSAEKKGLKVPVPPSLKKSAKHARTLQSIQGTTLFSELRSFESELRKLLSTNQETKIIMNDFSELERLERFASLELDLTDWKKVRETQPSALLKTPFKTSGFQNLDGLLRAHYDFYRDAIRRDQTMFQNFNRELGKKKGQLSVVVTGGFHSAGMTHLLKDSKIPYVLLTPKINKLGGEANYQRVMRGDVSYMKHFRGSRWDAFARDYSARLGAMIQPSDLTPALKRWRDRIIQNSIAENKITSAKNYTRYVDALFTSMRKQYEEDALWRLEGRSEVELRASLREKLDEFLPLYFNAFQSDMQSKFESFSEGLQILWREGDFSPAKVASLLDFRALPKTSKLATALTLIPDQRTTIFQAAAGLGLTRDQITQKAEQLQSLALSPTQMIEALDAYEVVLRAEEATIGGTAAGRVRDALRNVPYTRDVLSIIQETRVQLQRGDDSGLPGMGVEEGEAVPGFPEVAGESLEIKDLREKVRRARKAKQQAVGDIGRFEAAQALEAALNDFYIAIGGISDSKTEDPLDPNDLSAQILQPQLEFAEQDSDDGFAQSLQELIEALKKQEEQKVRELIKSLRSQLAQMEQSDVSDQNANERGDIVEVVFNSVHDSIVADTFFVTSSSTLDQNAIDAAIDLYEISQSCSSCPINRRQAGRNLAADRMNRVISKLRPWLPVNLRNALNRSEARFQTIDPEDLRKQEEYYKIARESQNDALTEKATGFLEILKDRIPKIIPKNLAPHEQAQWKNTKVIVSDKVPTFGMVIFFDQFSAEPVIVINSKFAEELSDAELVGVIAHELGHILYGDAIYTAFNQNTREASMMRQVRYEAGALPAEDDLYFKLREESEIASDLIGLLAVLDLFGDEAMEAMSTLFEKVEAVSPHIEELDQEFDIEEESGHDYHMKKDDRQKFLQLYIKKIRAGDLEAVFQKMNNWSAILQNRPLESFTPNEFSILKDQPLQALIQEAVDAAETQSSSEEGETVEIQRVQTEQKPKTTLQKLRDLFRRSQTTTSMGGFGLAIEFGLIVAEGAWNGLVSLGSSIFAGVQSWINSRGPPTPSPTPATPTSPLEQRFEQARSELRVVQEEYDELQNKLRTDEAYQRELQAKEAEVDLANQRFRDAQDAITEHELNSRPNAVKKITDLMAKIGLAPSPGASPATMLESLLESDAVQKAYKNARAILQSRFAGELDRNLERPDLENGEEHLDGLVQFGDRMREELERALVGVDPQIAKIVIAVVLLEAQLNESGTDIDKGISFLGESGKKYRTGNETDLFGRGRSQLIAALGMVLEGDVSAPTGIGKSLTSLLAISIKLALDPGANIGQFLENTDSELKYAKDISKDGSFEGLRKRTVGGDADFAKGVSLAEIGALLGFRFVRASDYIGEKVRNPKHAVLHQKLKSDPRAVLLMDTGSIAQLGNQFDSLSKNRKLDARDLYEFIQDEMDMKVIDEVQFASLARMRAIIATSPKRSVITNKLKPTLPWQKSRIKKGLNAAHIISEMLANGEIQVLREGDVHAFLEGRVSAEDAENPVPEGPVALVTEEGVELNRAATELLRKRMKAAKTGYVSQREFKSFIKALIGQEVSLEMATVNGRLEQKPFDPLKGVEKKQQSSDIALQLGTLYRFMFLKEHSAAIEAGTLGVGDVVADLFDKDGNPIEGNRDAKGNAMLSRDEKIQGISIKGENVQVSFNNLEKWFNWRSIGKLDTKTGTPIQEVFARGARGLSATLTLFNKLLTGNFTINLGISRPDLDLLKEAGRLNLNELDFEDEAKLDAQLDQMIAQAKIEAAKKDAKGNSHNPIFIIPLSRYHGKVREKLAAAGFDIQEISSTTTGDDVQRMEGIDASESFAILGSSRIATGRDFKGTLAVFGVGIESYAADLLAQMIGRDRSGIGAIHLYASRSGFEVNFIQAILGAEAGDFIQFLKRHIQSLENELADTRTRSDRSKEPAQVKRLEEAKRHLRLIENLQRMYKTSHSADEVRSLLRTLFEQGRVDVKVQPGERADVTVSETFELSDFFGVNAQYRYMMAQSHAARFMVTSLSRNEILTKPLKALKAQLTEAGESPTSRRMKALDKLIKEIEEGKILDVDTYLDRRVTSGQDFVRGELEMQINFILGEGRIREESVLERLRKAGFGNMWSDVETIFRVTELKSILRGLQNTNEFELTQVQAEQTNSATPERFSIAQSSGRNLRDFFKTLSLFSEHIVSSHTNRQPAAGQVEIAQQQKATQEEKRGKFEADLQDAFGGDANLFNRAKAYLERRGDLRGRRVSQSALNFLNFIKQSRDKYAVNPDTLQGELEALAGILKRGKGRLRFHEGCDSAASCGLLSLNLAMALNDEVVFSEQAQGHSVFNRVSGLLNGLSATARSEVRWSDLVRALRNESAEGALARLGFSAEGGSLSLAQGEQRAQAWKDEREQKRFRQTATRIAKRMSVHTQNFQRHVFDAEWIEMPFRAIQRGWDNLWTGFYKTREFIAGKRNALRSRGYRSIYQKVIQPFFGGKRTLGHIRENVDASAGIEGVVTELRARFPYLSETELTTLAENWDEFSAALGDLFDHLSPEDLPRFLQAFRQVQSEVGETAFTGNTGAVAREAYRVAFNRSATSAWAQLGERVSGGVKVGVVAFGVSIPAILLVFVGSLPLTIATVGAGLFYGAMNLGAANALLARFKNSSITPFLQWLARSEHQGFMGALLYAPKKFVERPWTNAGNNNYQVRKLDDLIRRLQGQAKPHEMVALRAAKIRIAENGCEGSGCDAVNQIIGDADAIAGRTQAFPGVSIFEQISPELGAALKAGAYISGQLLTDDQAMSEMTLAQVRTLVAAVGLPANYVWDLIRQFDQDIQKPSERVLNAMADLGIRDEDLHLSELKEIARASRFLDHQLSSPGRYTEKDFLKIAEGFLLTEASLEIFAEAAGINLTRDAYEMYKDAVRTDARALRRAQAKERIAKAMDALKSNDRTGGQNYLDQAFALDSSLGKRIAEVEYDFRLAGGKDYVYDALQSNIDRIENDLRVNRSRYWPEEIKGLKTQLKLLRARLAGKDDNSIFIDPNADAAALQNGSQTILSKSFLTVLNQLRRDPKLGDDPVKREQIIQAMIGVYLMHEETEARLDVMNAKVIRARIQALEAQSSLTAAEEAHLTQLREIQLLIGEHNGMNDLGKAFRDYQANLMEMYLFRTLSEDQLEAGFYAFEKLSAVWGQASLLDKITPLRTFAREGRGASPLEKQALNPDSASWTRESSPVSIFNNYFRHNDVFGYIFEFQDAVRNGFKDRAQAILNREKAKNFDEHHRRKAEANISEPMIQMMEALLEHADKDRDEREQAVDAWWHRIEENALYMFSLYHDFDDTSMPVNHREPSPSLNSAYVAKLATPAEERFTDHATTHAAVRSESRKPVPEALEAKLFDAAENLFRYTETEDFFGNVIGLPKLPMWLYSDEDLRDWVDLGPVIDSQSATLRLREEITRISEFFGNVFNYDYIERALTENPNGYFRLIDSLMTFSLKPENTDAVFQLLKVSKAAELLISDPEPLVNMITTAMFEGVETAQLNFPDYFDPFPESGSKASRLQSLSDRISLDFVAQREVSSSDEAVKLWQGMIDESLTATRIQSFLNFMAKEREEFVTYLDEAYKSNPYEFFAVMSLHDATAESAIKQGERVAFWNFYIGDRSYELSVDEFAFYRSYKFVMWLREQGERAVDVDSVRAPLEGGSWIERFDETYESPRRSESRSEKISEAAVNTALETISLELARSLTLANRSNIERSESLAAMGDALRGLYRDGISARAAVSLIEPIFNKLMEDYISVRLELFDAQTLEDVTDELQTSVNTLEGELTREGIWNLFTRVSGLPELESVDVERAQVSAWLNSVRDLLNESNAEKVSIPSNVRVETLTIADVVRAGRFIAAMRGIQEKKVIEYRISPEVFAAEDSEILLEGLIESVKNLNLLNENFNFHLIAPSGPHKEILDRIYGRTVTARDQLTTRIRLIDAVSRPELVSVLAKPDIIITDDALALANQTEGTSVFDAEKYERENAGLISYSGEFRVTPAQIFLASASSLSQDMVESLAVFENGLMRAYDSDSLTGFALIAQALAQEILEQTLTAKSA